MNQNFDERQMQVNEKGLSACGAIAILYTVGKLIYTGVNDSLAVPELVMLVIYAFILHLIDDRNQNYALPKTLFGKPVNVKKRSGRILSYALASAFFALAWAVMDHLFIGSELHPVLDFVICLAVCFAIECFTNEAKVRKYQQYMNQLDEEENNLDD